MPARYWRLPCIIAAALLITNCGGGGGSSSSSSTQSTAPSPTTLTGIFVDSPVAGLEYSTATRTGTTSASGEFEYLNGETVTFSLGNLDLGSTTASREVSPIDLAGGNSLDEVRQLGTYNRLVNTLLLLQSLDLDGNPENGIDLTGVGEQIRALSLDFNIADESFITDSYRRLVNLLGGRYVAPRNAVNHLLSTLNESITVSVPTSQQLEFISAGISRNTNFESNELGQLITITTDAGNRAELTYTDMGQIQTIEEFGSNGETSTLETFSYDSRGQLISQVLNNSGELSRSLTYVYDEAGNVVEQTTRTSSNNFGTVLGLYYVEVLLVPNLFLTPPVGEISGGSIVRGGLTEAVLSPGLGQILLAPQEPTISETTTTFNYLEDGTLSSAVQGETRLSLNDSLDCFEFESTPQAGFAIGGLPGSPLQLNVANIDFCDSVQEIQRDARSRITEVLTNLGTRTTIQRFVYDGDLLITQESILRREGQADLINRAEYSYNTFGDLVEFQVFASDELQTRFTREYETRVLQALP